MAPDPHFFGLPLTRHQPQRIDAPRGVLVHCLHGALWVTQDGDPRDIVLGPGEEHRLEHDAVTFVSALEDSRYLLLREPATPASADGWMKALQARFAHALGEAS